MLVRNTCTLHGRCAVYGFFFVLGEIERVNAQNAPASIPGSTRTPDRPADYRAQEKKTARGGHFFFYRHVTV